MEETSAGHVNDYKLGFETEKQICRCCLSTNRRMERAIRYSAFIYDLALIQVSESDGLPHWICWECIALLNKAVKFKAKVIKTHAVLFDYLSRCAPFPIDAKDPELCEYAGAVLESTPVLTFHHDGKGKTGYHEDLQHEKPLLNTEIQTFDLPMIPIKFEDDIKVENGFSDYDDSMTVEVLSANVEDVEKLSEEDLNELLADKDISLKDETKKKKTKKKRDGSKKENGEKSKKEEIHKSSIRKHIDLDPEKIRIVILNPEEQLKAKELETKTSSKLPYCCHLCFKGFNYEEKLQNHMKKHSPSRGKFSCDVCQMYLPTSYSLSVHSLIHTQRYECVQCGHRMTDKNSILHHYRTKHEGLSSVYTCNVCGKNSNNSRTHYGHVRRHHSARPECERCGKTFVNNDSLNEHMLIHKGIKNYECEVCGARFRTRTQAKYHELKHSNARDYYCVECDTRFKSPFSLKQHLSKSVKHRDPDSLKHRCTLCDKRFASAGALESHRGVRHEGLRPHACGQCGASLASAASLHKHVRAVHQGHKPPLAHVCHTCGKAFRSSSVLTNHVRTHTGEKPFSCEVCSRRFSQRTAMKTHLRLVHLART